MKHDNQWLTVRSKPSNRCFIYLYLVGWFGYRKETVIMLLDANSDVCGLIYCCNSSMIYWYFSCNVEARGINYDLGTWITMLIFSVQKRNPQKAQLANCLYINCSEESHPEGQHKGALICIKVTQLVFVEMIISLLVNFEGNWQQNYQKFQRNNIILLKFMLSIYKNVRYLENLRNMHMKLIIIYFK